MKTLSLILPLLLACGCVSNPDRVAIYAGVAGVCYSADDAKHGRFPDYPLHESAVTLSTADLDGLIDGLEVAGFFEDSGRSLPEYSVPVMAFWICAVRDGRAHEAAFYHRQGHQVPERYLRLIEAHSPSRPAALGRFLRANRELRSEVTANRL